MGRIIGICVLVLIVAVISIMFIVRFSPKEESLSIPDPEEDLLKAERMLLEDDSQIPQELPVEESGNNGYWWIKQNDDRKLVYAEYLIEVFGLEDKGLISEKVVEELDSFYSPKDNPLDIKMDISIERAFNTIRKGMVR